MINRVPSYLKSGDKVAICATARWLERGEEREAVELLTSAGFQVEVFPEVFEKDGQLAGSDEVRAKSLQTALDDSSCRAILIARGGYGTARILEHLIFSKWLENPSWICGYSDITALLGHIENLGVAGIHSTMPISFPVATSIAKSQLVSALKGELKTIEWQGAENVESIDIQGKLVGGNLSVLYSVLGSVSFPELKEAILFIEDVDEMVYHIDRMLLGLRRAGVLKGLKAVVVGGMTQMRDNTIEYGFKTDNPFGLSVEEVVERWGKELGIPVIWGFPAGHQNDNRAFYCGRNVSIQGKSGHFVLNFLD
ncbi:MAG: LD-carboxypeptidase [Flavobacteriales bacterium]